MKNLLKLSVVTVVALTISGYLFYQGLKPELQNLKPPSSPAVLGKTKESLLENLVQVTNIVDGDTIEVLYQGEKLKVRYIGINTPETVDPRKPVECFGKQASDENKRLLEGKKVILEKDISETDKFDRLLRYVYLPLEDGSKLFVNDYLVREGFAFADTFPPDVKYSKRFIDAGREARENLRGLWASCKVSK